MKFTMRIKSITDVITNSSSEVFVIKRQNGSKSDPMKMIDSVCKDLGLKTDKILSWEIAKRMV